MRVSLKSADCIEENEANHLAVSSNPQAEKTRIGGGVNMTAATLLQLVPAFFLGCILTEIRWIVRMRQLRGDLGRRETTRPSIPTSL